LAQDPAWDRFYSLSGFLLILGLLGGLGNIAIFATGPPPGTGVEATLRYTANNQLIFWIGNAVLGSAIRLLLPAIVALYIAQRSLGEAPMLLATLFAMTGLLVFASILPVVFSLPTLGSGYATAANEAQRAAYMASTMLALSEIASGLVMFVFLMAVWTVVSAALMTKGGLGKRLGYVGMISGMGLAGAGVNLGFPTPGLDLVDALSILWLVWLFGVGYRLLRLGASAPYKANGG
jgi:hypothetical protein